MRGTKRPTSDASAIAAAEELDTPPVVAIDEDGYYWVSVRIKVPALDVELWEERSHQDHPDNAPARGGRGRGGQ